MHGAIIGLVGKAGGETITEGVRGEAPGVLTRQAIPELVEDTVLVNEAELEQAIHRWA